MSNARTLASTINSSSQIVVPSGGVNFGTGTDGTGTVAGGVLDDYEEGTFTLTVANWGFTQSNSGFSNLKYVKIARNVFIQGSISLSSSGYASAYSRFTGIPFGCMYGVGNYTSGVIAGGGIGGQIYLASNSMYFYRANSSVTSTTWEFAVVYYTTS